MRIIGISDALPLIFAPGQKGLRAHRSSLVQYLVRTQLRTVQVGNTDLLPGFIIRRKEKSA